MPVFENRDRKQKCVRKLKILFVIMKNVKPKKQNKHKFVKNAYTLLVVIKTLKPYWL